ncbi:TonB family protein [Tsuneonella sp. HG094]
MAKPVRVVPTVARRHPSEATATGRKVDIPQAAKDAGHNGSVTWQVSVGEDGKAAGYTLIDTSHSPAIDATAREWAERAYYLPALDAQGAKVAGTARVLLSYARWDRRSPGGGLDDYTCADLVREADWFAAANRGERAIFWLENAYTSLPGLRAIERGEPFSRQQREASYARREKEWQKVIGRCRKAPDRPFLEQVDDAQFYRSIVESF